MDDRTKELYDRLILSRMCIEQYRTIIMALLTRCGGDVTINQDELTHNDHNYRLTEQVSFDSNKTIIRVKLSYNPHGDRTK